MGNEWLEAHTPTDAEIAKGIHVHVFLLNAQIAEATRLGLSIRIEEATGSERVVTLDGRTQLIREPTYRAEISRPL